MNARYGVCDSMLHQTTSAMNVFWKVRELPKSTSVIAIDVFEKSQCEERSAGIRQCTIKRDSETTIALQFLLTHLGNGNTTVRFLLPAVSGYLIQSDFLHRRLVDCIGLVQVQTFATLEQQFSDCGTDAYDALDISQVVKLAIGAVVFSGAIDDDFDTTASQMDQQLHSRLSFSWYSSEPVPKRLVAAIRPGPVKDARNLSKIEDLATIAASLNISLIMLDDPNHGLGSDEWAHLREDFIPVDMTLDSAMSQRIASAVAQYPKQIHGMVCMYEPLLEIVAEAAALSHLFTSPLEAIANARNKQRTRRFCPSLFCHEIKNSVDLEDFLDAYRTIMPISLPLIVKPASGWASEGVSKAASEDEVRAAVTKLWQPPFSAKYGRDEQGLVLIEPYVSGPEVDCNMVLVDGEVIFCEINDDFPSSGDVGSGDFVETLNAMPSILPEGEIAALRSKVHSTLLAMGFRTGVFHVEARIHNSSFDYTKQSEGVIDLTPSADARNTVMRPTIFILEVNPRPPGPRTGAAAARTYGVSYRSLSLLSAIGDHQRMRALAVPFIDGAQYHMQVLFVAAQRGGNYQYGDICREILEQEPIFRSHVVDYTTFLRDGQEIPDPRLGRTTGLAHFLVVSRKDRREARSISDKIQALVRSSTEEF